MTAVGGDYYDFVQLDEHRLAIIVADVVGHGLAAAMLMAKISAESRFALALNSDPVDATMAVNRALSSMNVDKFVTMLVGMVDIRDHSVTFVNAGHMRPIVIRASGEVEELTIKGTGLPLGVLEETTYGSHRFELKSGDSIVFYTDGVNEAMNESNEQLGIQNVLQELRGSQSKTVDAIGNSICQTVRRHVGSHEQIDDICVVAFSYHPKKRKSPITT
jgi:serine phosphatase RsbU (regulator of sigma subunit)